MSRSDPSVVYVLVPELMGYFSGIHRGIRRFALEQRSWRFRICPTPKVARQMLKLDNPRGFVIGLRLGTGRDAGVPGSLPVNFTHTGDSFG